MHARFSVGGNAESPSNPLPSHEAYFNFCCQRNWRNDSPGATHVWVNTLARYALAVVSVAVALLITRLLQPTVFPTPLFFVAVVITTWFGGAGAGIFAVAFATVILNHYFVSPDTGTIADPAALLYLAQFSLPALLTCWFVKKRKEAETALKEARDQLDAKVQQRTLQLQSTNEQLQSEIVERKRTEEAFLKTQADLAHLTRITTMSELATSIAHEVNQPLAAIVTTGDACLRWLANEPPNVDRAKDSIARIINEGNRAGDVIRRIRALSTKTNPHKAPLQINGCIQEILALLKVELNKNNIALNAELEENLPLVFGDSVQLQQVILNLLINGIDAMNETNSRPRTLLVRSETLPQKRVQVLVRDTGCGFDPSQAEQLFETFFTTKPNGIGMGLSISRTIIEAHGGKLTASAAPDSGATFQFDLPIADANETRP
jgi:C4-dicarboxylate-specific signal transduction histidine kinase